MNYNLTYKMTNVYLYTHKYIYTQNRIPALTGKQINRINDLSLQNELPKLSFSPLPWHGV